MPLDYYTHISYFMFGKLNTNDACLLRRQSRPNGQNHAIHSWSATICRPLLRILSDNFYLDNCSVLQDEAALLSLDSQFYAFCVRFHCNEWTSYKQNN